MLKMLLIIQRLFASYHEKSDAVKTSLTDLGLTIQPSVGL